MLYKIFFTYSDHETGQKYQLTGVKNGSDPGEAIYYFRKQYPHCEIEITRTEQIIL